MAHQCLQCGEVYEEGSPELLKGCADCGGTRFFFTQEPLSREDRQELKAQADEDLKAIVKGLLEEDVRPDYEDDIWSKDTRKQWLSVDPESAGQTVKEYVQDLSDGELDEETGEVAGELEELVEDKGVMDHLDIDFVGEDSADEGVVEVDRFVEPEVPDAPAEADEEPEVPVPEVAADGGPEEPGEAVAVGEVTPFPEDLPEGMVVEEADEDEEVRPEVVTVDEPGRYRIDVEALMADNPIIVQNDGRYLVHLPSLFQSEALKKP